MIHVVLAGTFVIELIRSSLIFWSHKLPTPFNFSFAPYNQLFQQILDPCSAISENLNGINVLVIRVKDLNYNEENIRSLIDLIKLKAEKNHLKFIVCVCPDISSLYRSLENNLIDSLKKIKGCSVIGRKEIRTLYSSQNFYDEESEELAQIPYTSHFFNALGTLIARKIYAYLRIPYKVIVLDCDNTLWKGICGEDKIANIQISSPYKALQLMMLKQYKAGILLCLASKNNEEDVIAVFEKYPEMQLKWEYLTLHKINWELKSQNLKLIAEELNLSLDSFIFIDDNPVECAEVRSQCPEVLTLLLPPCEASIPKFFKNIWVFDHCEVTKEDKKRTDSYKQNAKRDKLRKQSVDLQGFILKLCIKIEILEMAQDEISRVSQLIARTNQFNFTTIRRSEAEILFLKQSGLQIKTVKVKDKFGDYGLVGVIIYKIENDYLDVDTLLLSCRVLGKGVEHQIVSYLAETALTHHLKNIRLNYKVSGKNQPVLNFLQTIEGINRIHKGGEHNHKETDVYFILDAEQGKKITFNSMSNVALEPLSKGLNIADDLNCNKIINTSEKLVELTAQLTTIALISQAINFDQQVSRPLLEEVYILPVDSLQKELVKIWEFILKTAPIGIQDDFFKLGGDSLKAVQLVSMIYKRHSIQLSPAVLFAAPTIDKLTDFIRQNSNKNQDSKYPPIYSLSSQEKALLSFSQQRLWVLDTLFSEKAIYNISLGFQIKGKLSVEILKNSFDVLLMRHEVLRTHFCMTGNGSVYQEVQDHVSFPLELADLTNQEKDKEILIQNEAWKPFILNKEPLIRGKLFQSDTENNIFIFTMHHLIGDEASLKILFREVSELYQSLEIKKTTTLPPLSFQYRDFAMWQRQWLEQGVLAKQLAYWQKQLSSLQSIISLPTSKLRVQNQTFRGAVYTHQISKDIVESLKKISLEQETTLFMTLLGAFQVFLHRYTNQNDILVGSPIANRHYPGVSDMIGLFVNILPLRANFEQNQSFIQFLKETRKTILEAYENQDAPFDKILETLKIKRCRSCHPLIQVVFLLRNKMESFTIDHIEIEQLKVLPSYTAFDLTVIAEPILDGLLFHFEYSLDLFDENRVKSMSQYFENLLKGIIANPTQMIGKLPLLLDQELHQQLFEWNQTEVKYLQDKLIHELFEEQVKKTPDAIAAEFKNKKYTYLELNKRSHQIACGLRQHGVKANEIVAICIYQSNDLLAAILAILKSGAAFVLLDPDYPESYLQFVLDDTNAKNLIVDIKNKKKFQKFCGRKWLVEIEDFNLFQESDDFKSTETASNAAYVVYTSGSTGKPKGVIIEHQSLCTFANGFLKSCRMNSESRMLQFSSISFDAIIAEIFPTLLAGGTIVFMLSKDRLNPEKLVKIFKRHRIKIAIIPPSFVAALSDTIDFSCLQTLIVAGEANRKDVVKKWSKKLCLLNAYGPTEATVCSTIYEYKDSLNCPETTIGTPIDHIKTYILDCYLNLLPVGAVGELYIGGASVAKEYLNNKELTSERFISDPFSSQVGARLYKTGDLVRYLPDGNIDYIGRNDNQIKLNGHRIELTQIESCLLDLENIREAVVTLNEDLSNQKQLIAYITLKAQKSENSTDLRQQLSLYLPSFMIPNMFIILEKMPLLPNGKIDRHHLPTPSRCILNNGLPRTVIEYDLVTIWEEILNVKGVGIFDDFFELGGHSLLVLQLVAKIHKKFHCTIPIADFYFNPTIETISRIIKSADAKTRLKQLLLIQDKGRDKPLILIHPSSGLAFPYTALADHILEKSIYGINNPFLGLNHFLSLKEMASYYVDLILKSQLKEPYHLGGWSFGGVVAFEMAQQLKALGLVVEVVILIDSHPVVHEMIKPSSDINPGLNLEQESNARLLKNYQPAPYSGRVALLKAKDDLNKDSFNQWEQFVQSKLEVYQLSQKHAELFEKVNVHEVAENLKKIFLFNDQSATRISFK